MNLTQTVKDGVDKVRTYWKTPPKGRYMNFREIAAYSGGGIGAYMIITLGNACLLAMGNTLISSTLGVGATDMYFLYVVAILINVFTLNTKTEEVDFTEKIEMAAPAPEFPAAAPSTEAEVPAETPAE